MLGEAAVQLDAAFKDTHSEIDWAKPSQLRNRIVQGCWSIDLEILHTPASEMLPSYIKNLRTVLSEGGAHGHD